MKEATHRCVASYGGGMTIALVAADLGVSRQTVYRYFRSTEALLLAAAFDGTRAFLSRLARRLRLIDDPGEALVEAVAYTIQQIPREPYLRLLLVGSPHSLIRSVTSETARDVGRSLLGQTAVDWEAAGIGSTELSELIEWTLRTVQSFLVDPGDPVRTTPELREYLRRWLAPAVTAAAARSGVGARPGAAS